MRSVRRFVLSVVFILVLVAGSVAGFAFADLRPQLGLDLVGGVSVILTAPPGTAPDVLEKTVDTIRGRVDALGVAEPDITLQGEQNIQVQIPGGGNQERLLRLISKTARLEFREVLAEIQPGTPEYKKTDLTTTDTQGPAVFPGEAEEGQEPPRFRLGKVLLSGDAISRAVARAPDPQSGDPNCTSSWCVGFDLTSEGGKRFADITQRLTNKQLAIVLDKRVESAPTVNEQITGGSGIISGTFTEQEAKDLAVVLKIGALPVNLQQSQVETVSPTLGKESLRQGLIAGLVGLLTLAIYLAFYYRLLGMVTWFGMAIWSVFALALVSLLGRAYGYSLTLAGVAGLVVSLGITADSYIVFYERLKDEVRHGKTLRVAVGPAFKRAWRTIVAADIVTITAAVILYLLAIGSVRGFALTLGLATGLDMFVVYFFKRPLVFLIARSRFLSELRGMGLRAGVAQAPQPQPAPVGGGER